MSNIVVIYKSKYGNTEQYARWIAQELGADFFEASTVKPGQLLQYDVVVYGGGLYAGGIDGARLVTKNPCKSLVVFTVGLADPVETDYTEVLARNFSKELLQITKVFHLRGAIDYGNLKPAHKSMMAVLKSSLSKKNESELSSEEKAILSTYGGSVSFVDKAATVPIVGYVKELA